MNLGLFDFLESEKNMQMKKLVGQFSIEKFTKFDIRGLTYNNYLIIDILAIEEDIDFIIKNLVAIKTLYDMRIILLADELDPGELKKIIDETRIYNIITETTVDKIKEEMLLCISPNGMTKEYIKRKIYSNYGFELEIDKYIFGNEVKIVLAGSIDRIGTTTLAMNISSYLEQLGARVSYTEANNSEHLKSIHKVFFEDNIIKENYFSSNGVDYFFNFNIPYDYNFNIIDLGVLNEANINILSSVGDVKILCGGTRPYEIPRLSESMEKLKDIKSYNILIPKGDMLNIKNYLLRYENNTIYRINYSKSLFDGEENKEIWEQLLEEHIIRH